MADVDDPTRGLLAAGDRLVADLPADSPVRQRIARELAQPARVRAGRAYAVRLFAAWQAGE